MFGRLISVLIGFILACLAAGFTKVFFATTPSELAGLPTDVASDRISKVFESGLFASAQCLLFAAPFALVAAAIGEWRSLRDWTYYAVVGLAIALVGFLAQYSSEAQGQPTIVNNYALSAFLTAGFAAGLVYWLFAGRSAGGASANVPSVTPVQRSMDDKTKPATGAKPGTTGGSAGTGAKPATPGPKPTTSTSASTAVPTTGPQPKKA